MPPEYPLPDPMPDHLLPDGWHLTSEKNLDTAQTYWNHDLGLYVYAYTDAGIVPDDDPQHGVRAWGVNLERARSHPYRSEKEPQIAATSVQNRSVGSARAAANLYAVIRGYMELAETLDDD